MRVAFFVLLLVNLAFMAWAGWVDTPRQAKTPDATARLPRLKLVSEASTPKQGNNTGGTGGGAVQKMAMTTASPPPAALAAPAETARCVSVGPFNDIATAAKAVGALQTRGLATSNVRAAPGDVEDGYWVYIAGVADAAAAAKIVETLGNGGIKDAHLMPEIDDAHRISVGLFSELPRAAKRAKAVAKLGFRPEVGPHTQTATVYWVDLALKASDQAVPVQDLLSADSGNTHLSVETCPAPGVQPAAAPSVPASPTETAPASPPATAATVAGTPKLH